MNQPSADSAPIAAAVIVVDGRLLLVRRAVAEGELVWQFPAGEVEPDEAVEDAAVREVGEETGLTVRAGAAPGRAGPSDHRPDDGLPGLRGDRWHGLRGGRR